VEDFIGEKWGDCKWGELSSFTDVMQWYDRQKFSKNISWSSVLDHAEVRYKCEFNASECERTQMIQIWLGLKFQEEEEVDKPLCINCEIETRKHCDDCGGYGSHSEEKEEEEEGEEEENEKNVQCARCGKEGDCDKDDFQDLPSKEDEENHSMLGEDMCLKCFEQFSEFAFVEGIKEV
jgi:hypothetical protein